MRQNWTPIIASDDDEEYEEKKNHCVAEVAEDDDDDLFPYFVTIIDSFLGELPEDEVSAFTQSEGFEVYRTVASNPEAASDDDRTEFFSVVDSLLGGMPDDAVQAFTVMISKFTASQSVQCIVDVRIWDYLTKLTIWMMQNLPRLPRQQKLLKAKPKAAKAVAKKLPLKRPTFCKNRKEAMAKISQKELNTGFPKV